MIRSLALVCVFVLDPARHAPEAAGGAEAVLLQAGMRSTGPPLWERMIGSPNEERA
jgi:hypothetical protein